MNKKGVRIMDRKAGIKILFVLFILGILMTNILSADTQKIRVVVKNSSIRLEPDVQSEIIDSPPLGAVFEVIEKMDVWYKVKLNSQKYGREEGYINIMFIEELQETEKPQQRAEEKQEIQKKDVKSGESEKVSEPGVKKEEKKEELEKPEVEAAGTGMDEDEIKTVVNEYLNALQNNSLLLFYEQNCTSEYLFEVREDAEWMSRTYDKINSCVSDISIQSIDSQGAEVRISLIITGLPRAGGSRKLLFDGIYTWNMIKSNNQWKIAGAISQSY